MAEFFEALKVSFNDTFGKSIELNGSSVMTLNIVLWSLFIGFLLGIGGTVYNKVILGKLVRALLDNKVTAEDKAMSLDELKVSDIFVKFALRRGSTFRRIVRMRGDTDEENNNIPVTEAKFYIPEENIYRAEKVYGNLGASFFTILISILALLIATLAALIVVPDLTQMAANLTSGT